MMLLLGAWAHWLATLLFAALAVSQVRNWRDRAGRALLIACIAMAAWTALASFRGVDAPVAQLAESARNFAWLVFLHILLQRGGKDYRSLRVLYAVLAFVVGANALIDVLNTIDPTRELPGVQLLAAAFALRMVFAVGALVAAHNLYTATADGARGGIGWVIAALGAMWAVDLTFYALSWAQGDWSHEFAAARGAVAAMLVPVLALAARRNAGWSIRLSRSVAFRSVGLIAAVGYLAFVIAAAFALQGVGGRFAAVVPSVVLLIAALVVAGVMATPDLRAWAQVMLAKHLFAHRYDYRAEWLRFTETLGLPGPEADPLDVRVVKAVADIVQSPGGVLLVPSGDGLVMGARWQWETLSPPHDPGGSGLSALLATGRIVELAPLRGEGGDSEEARALPEWVVGDPAIHAIVPLVHLDRLVGAVLLESPAVARPLDWEDFDLLRLAGRQVASYLAEARAHEALGEAARFDEFNRRFAFIMHDIKNLVSQLTLVTRNAERHADKPEFRADMIATLQSSTARMNDLLARLSQHNKGRIEEPRPVELHSFAAAVAEGFRKRHPIVVAGDIAAFALADPARLEQAVSHLVHNAIEASPPTEPVTLAVVRGRGETGITVEDRGCGMSADFVASTLFKPFASTKEGGFGVGAHEARALAAAMGGRLVVASTPDEGTRMTIWLPSAEPAVERRAA
jgi:putative PEP-CTERM system histidine kinase